MCKITTMRKIFIFSITSAFCCIIITGCGKGVKTPDRRSVPAKTSPASSPVTQTPGQDQNSPTCGSHSGSSGSSNSSGSY